MPSAPFYDNVRMGGPDGIRIPTELQRHTFLTRGDANGDINGSGVQLGLFRSTTVLTNAQILTLESAPVQLLAAPGTGYFYQIIKAILINENTGTAYAGTPGVITIGYTSTPSTLDALSGTIAATFLTSPTAFEFITVAGGLTSATAATSLQNQPIYISVATNNPTTGTGTLRVVLIGSTEIA